MKIKERQCHITKQLVHSFSVRPGEHHCSRLTNPDVNIKRMHQLYNVKNGYFLYILPHFNMWILLCSELSQIFMTCTFQILFGLKHILYVRFTV